MQTKIKPHLGFIACWTRREAGTGYIIEGVFSRFLGGNGNTSSVLNEYVCPNNTIEIETRNSRYTLVGPEGAKPPQRGPWVVLVQRSIGDVKHADIGDIVYPCNGHDYGCASDDWRITGLEHVSVSRNKDGSTPFFTIPECILRPAPWADAL